MQRAVRLWSWRQLPILCLWLIVFAWRIRHRHWYARFPFLPLPPKGYVKWRLELAYGDFPVDRATMISDTFNFAYALRQFERT